MFFKNKQDTKPIGGMGMGIPVINQSQAPQMAQPPREPAQEYIQHNAPPIIDNIKSDNDEELCSINISGPRSWVETQLSKLR